MEALGINGGYFLVQLVNFLIILIVLRAWVYTPVLGMLEKRRATIAKGLEDARVASDARANAEQEAAKIIAESQAKASQMVKEASERAENATRDIRAAAEADAVKIRENAAVEAQQERNRILGDLRGQVAALAIAATQKLLNESLDEKRQRSLLEEFFSGIKAGKVTVLEGTAMSGASAEVTSALPLTDSEQNAVKRDVLAKVGGDATVAFRVDPTILGGLVVRVGDKVIDGSVAGQLANLRETLR
ncbi:MAG: F0F1 ATP synthase subunit B [Anaerolineales bacterium]|nr:F0F1 ATP synthase subunit B [Anaerolineales bacterium]